MRILTRPALSLALTACILAGATDAESRIRNVLTMQVDAWNRGDIPAFVSSYAPDAIMVSKEIAHSRAEILARYQRIYSTRELMGHLTFGALEVRLLTPDVAVVTGEWRVDRSSGNPNHIGGLFSLVFQRHDKEWKIELDHTS
jgi:uncharacterized protein (TIGR02246 family)